MQRKCATGRNRLARTLKAGSESDSQHAPVRRAAGGRYVGRGKSTLIDALIRRHAELSEPRKIRTFPHEPVPIRAWSHTSTALS